MQKDALERLNLQQMLLEPEMFAAAEPASASQFARRWMLGPRGKAAALALVSRRENGLGFSAGRSLRDREG